LKPFFFSICLAVVVTDLSAFDLWQHPEVAERNSLFVSGAAPIYSFSDGFQLVPQFSFDYMLPVRFPFSVGGYFKTPSPNLTSFGVRAAYHINLDRPRTDFYFFYVFDFGFVRNDLLKKYNDERQPVHLYDFRAGFRQRINHFLFMQIETDFKFQGIIMGLSIKLF
jgi:hypothetical protein